jgi:hypothetical protein
VFPSDADIEQNKISVLAPIGTAILGCRVEDIVEWMVPAGTTCEVGSDAGPVSGMGRRGASVMVPRRTQLAMSVTA